MKRLIFLLSFFAPSFAFSQTNHADTVSSAQQNRTTEPSYSVLNVNTNPTYYTDVNIAGRFNPVTIYRDGKSFGDGRFSALRATTIADATVTCALEGITHESEYSGTLRSYAVKGESNGGSEGHRYGVFGAFSGRAGAGVYGTTGNDSGLLLGKPYAGYFNGDTKVNGDMEVKGAIKGWMLRQIPERYSELPYGHAMQRLQSFIPVSYYPNGLGGKAKQLQDEETKNSQLQYSSLASQVSSREHYALKLGNYFNTMLHFLYEDENGDQYINYTDLVPLLIQAVNELQYQINELRHGPSAPRAPHRAPSTTGFTQAEKATAQLFAAPNTPNPFNTTTSIEMNIPESVSKAELCVYNLNGKLYKSYLVGGRGQQRFSLSAADFEPGIYLYTLIADGQNAPTHRMIITK